MDSRVGVDWDKEEMRGVLMNTVILLCKNGITFKRNIRVQGLLGITIDDDDIFLVQINENVENECSIVLSDTVVVNPVKHASCTTKNSSAKFIDNSPTSKQLNGKDKISINADVNSNASSESFTFIDSFNRDRLQCKKRKISDQNQLIVLMQNVSNIESNTRNQEQDVNIDQHHTSCVSSSEADLVRPLRATSHNGDLSVQLDPECLEIEPMEVLKQENDQELSEFNITVVYNLNDLISSDAGVSGECNNEVRIKCETEDFLDSMDVLTDVISLPVIKQQEQQEPQSDNIVCLPHLSTAATSGDSEEVCLSTSEETKPESDIRCNTTFNEVSELIEHTQRIQEDVEQPHTTVSTEPSEHEKTYTECVHENNEQQLVSVSTEQSEQERNDQEGLNATSPCRKTGQESPELSILQPSCTSVHDESRPLASTECTTTFSLGLLEVETIIRRVLPKLEEQGGSLEAVLGRLVEIGVKNLKDLSEIEEQQLVPCLKLILARRLKRAAKAMAEVEIIITRVLSRLEYEDRGSLAEVMRCVEEIGVKNLKDLSEIEEEQLVPCLKVFTVLKLKEAARVAVDEVPAFIRGVLPELAESQLTAIVGGLQDIDVSKVKDLSLINEDRFFPGLQEFPMRKLIQAAKDSVRAMDRVLALIKQVLPELEESQLTAVMGRLEELGVRNIFDLCLIKEQQLVPYLLVFPIRKVLLAAKDAAKVMDDVKAFIKGVLFVEEHSLSAILNKIHEIGITNVHDVWLIKEHELIPFIQVSQIKKLLQAAKEMDEVHTFIKQVLPELEESQISAVMRRLVEIGVGTVSVLISLDEHKLVPCLTPILIKKLILAAKGAAHTLPPVSQSVPVAAAANSAASSSSLPPALPSTIPSHYDWVSRFVIPFQKFSKQLQNALEQKVCLADGLRRELVRTVVDSSMGLCPRPRRRDMDLIAAKLVNSYPSALKDERDGVVVGSGHGSLTKQLMSRIENVCRTQPGATIRRKRAASSDLNESERFASDGVGCVNWQPDLPSEESEETMARYKTDLLKMYARGEWDIETVRELSARSYYLQRKDINACTSMADLITEWPFLFTESELEIHVNELLGFDVRERLEKSVKDKGCHLLSLVPCSESEAIEWIMQQHRDDTTAESRRRNGIIAVLLPRLMSYFKEDMNILCIQAEVKLL